MMGLGLLVLVRMLDYLQVRQRLCQVWNLILVKNKQQNMTQFHGINISILEKKWMELFQFIMQEVKDMYSCVFMEQAILL